MTMVDVYTWGYRKEEKQTISPLYGFAIRVKELSPEGPAGKSPT
jgi:hypothetical protein